MQVLAGDVSGAVELHNYYHQIWNAFGAMPERFNWNLQVPEIAIYPLRPELAEATYLLYRATRDPHYLRVGASIIADIEVHCGLPRLLTRNTHGLSAATLRYMMLRPKAKKTEWKASS